MSDAAAWCVAVVLVGVGVAADGALAWMFISDWRRGRIDHRMRLKVRRRATGEHTPSAGARPHALGFIGIATVGITGSIAAARQPAAPPASDTPVIQATEPATSAPSSTPQHDAPDPSANGASAISVQLSIDFTNAYFYRGIRQQDKGLIVQPAARLTLRVIEHDDFKLDGFVGTWNSFGPNAGTQSDDVVKDWYESDLYAGFTLTRGCVSLTTSYTFLTSPSSAFETVQELGFTLAIDDSAWLKAWALKPYATLAIETGANASDGADSDNGVYLELGIAPGFSFNAGSTPIALTFPVSVGMSLADYYQNADATDDTFGFAQVGAKASIPLGTPSRFGAWTLNAGVSVLFLGDHTSTFNDGDDYEVIGTVGLQWNF